MVEHTLSPEWQQYFAAMKKKKLTLEDIRQQLLRDGYEKEFVKQLFILYGMKEEPMPREAHDEMEAYLMSCEEQGFSMTEAREELIKSGHAPDDVDVIIAEYEREKHLHTIKHRQPASTPEMPGRKTPQQQPPRNPY